MRDKLPQYRPGARRPDRGLCYRWCPRYWCGLGL